jgi:hypothetical protein
MTLYQFNSLDENEKHQLVWNEGVLLASREDNELKYLLYQVDSFYVELKYDVCSNEIKPCKSFVSTNFLEPYLTQINLNDLF